MNISTSQTHNKIFPHVYLLIVSLILFCAVTLIPAVLKYDIWVDEGWTISVVRSAAIVTVHNEVAEDVHPPLYFYLLYGWRLVAGDSIFALRYFTVLQFFLTTAVIMAWGRAMAGIWAGLLAGLLFAVHDLSGVLALEFRQYTQLTLMSALVGLFYWRWWQGERRLMLVGFILAALGLLYTQYWGVFVLLGVGLHWLSTLTTHRRKALRQCRAFALAVAAIALAYLPWVPIMLNQLNDVPEGLGHSLPNNSTGYEIYFFQLVGTPEWFWAIMAVGALIVLKRRTAAVLPLLIVIVGVGGSIGMHQVIASLWYRSGVIVLPALFVLVGATTTHFSRPAAFVLVAFILVHSLNTTAAQQPPRLPWVDVSTYLTQRTDDTDIIVMDMWWETYSLDYYLGEQANPPNHSLLEIIRRNENDAAMIALLDSYSQDYNGIWLVKESPTTARATDLEARGWILSDRIRWEDSVHGMFLELQRYDLPPDDGRVLTNFGPLPLLRGDIVTGEDWLTVQLLWSATEPIERSYTISTFLLDNAGQLVAQDDSPPAANRNPTIGWLPNSLHYDAHVIDISKLPAGDYTVGVKVYYFSEDFSTITDVPCNAGSNCPFYVLDTVTLP